MLTDRTAGNIRPVWIELCQKARVDPHELVTTHVDAILEKVFSAISVAAKVRGSSSCLSCTPNLIRRLARTRFLGGRIPRNHNPCVRRAGCSAPQSRGPDQIGLQP